METGTLAFPSTPASGMHERFTHTMDLFFIAIAKEAGRIPDLKSYITIRRAAGIPTSCSSSTLPALACPARSCHLVTMEETTNDLVTWSK